MVLVVVRSIRIALYTIFVLSVCNQFFFSWGVVPSSSMEPTLAKGSFIVVQKFNVRPKDGDIVTFYPPKRSGLSVKLVKRVEGVGGQWVSVQDGELIRDGRLVPSLVRANYSMPKTYVPKGKLFVLGDNRNHSYDSHIWGSFSERRVIGVAVLELFPKFQWLSRVQ